jgi:hypothetical protein
MKIRKLAATLLLASSVAAAYAASGCMELCQQTLKRDVALCNYPEKEAAALRECLATARKNFDACKTGCGN